MLTSQIFPSLSSHFYSHQVRFQKPRSKEPQKCASQLSSAIDSVSAVDALASCASSRNLELGVCLHALVLKSRLKNNVFVNNSLLNMYTKCQNIEDAARLFDHMPERTMVSWTSMISGYCQNGAADKAIALFCEMLKNVHSNEFTLAALLQACAKKDDAFSVECIHCLVVKLGLLSDGFLRNCLIDAYAKSGLLLHSEKLLERFSCGDVVAWTSVISGYVFNGMMEEALAIFMRMQVAGILPNEVTILSILHACSLINHSLKIRWVHGVVIKMGLCGNDLIINSLVEVYVLNGHFKEAMEIFGRFSFMGDGCYLSPETMASLLQQCGHWRYVKLGKEIHGYLSKHGFFPCIVIENSLIDMYAENGDGESAYQLFARMNQRDIVSWNTMITCLVKNGESHQALMLLQEIHRRKENGSVSPDFITMLASIQACSNLESLQLGGIIHGYITRAGLINDIFVQNALIDMYGRSGQLDLAENIFKEMLIKDLGSWNSLISAYGVNGEGTSALRVFTELKKSSSDKPNAITYVNILSACAHSGMVKEGFEVFRCMYRDGVEPSMEHFVCMVDLLGRSGRLEEAEAFIEEMPVKPGPEVWGALLGACGLFGNITMAERAAKQLSTLEPESRIWRVALSNVYASVGNWESAAKMRAEMKGLKGTGKEAGWSSVEVGGYRFKFMVNDTRHPESKTIYQVLSRIMEHISDEVRV